MKVFTCILLMAVVVMTMTAGASAQTNTTRWDFDGTQSLTDMGWTLAGTPGDQFTKSKDYSTGVNDNGVTGININDNNTGPLGNAYMRMYKNTPQGVDQSQGLVMARVKYISGGSTNGTFGYTTSVGASVVVGVRNGQVNIKNAEGTSTAYNGGSSITVPGVTTEYRVYALHWGIGGVFDLWVSNGNDWSANSADWTQLASSGGWASQSALIDETGTARTGIILGSFGSSSTLWQGNIDYVVWSKNSVCQTPWSLEPTVITPEPGSLVALGSGLMGMLGFAIRRKRA